LGLPLFYFEYIPYTKIMKKIIFTIALAVSLLVIANAVRSQEVSKGKQLATMLTNKEDPKKY